MDWNVVLNVIVSAFAGYGVVILATWATEAITKRYEKKSVKNIPCLALQPIEKSELEAFKIQCVIDKGGVSTTYTNLDDSFEKRCFYLTNFGESSAINITLKILVDNKLVGYEMPFSLFKAENRIIEFSIKKDVDFEKSAILAADCKSVIGENYHFDFPFIASVQNGKPQLGIQLFSEPKKEQHTIKTKIKLGKPRIELIQKC